MEEEEEEEEEDKVFSFLYLFQLLECAFLESGERGVMLRGTSEMSLLYSTVTRYLAAAF
jgi:hypothetical protein